jgi:hypothetical protein
VFLLSETLPRFPAGLFFCAALDSGVPHKLGCSSLFVLEGSCAILQAFSRVGREGDIVDVLAAVEDFLLAQATYQAARQRWPNERIRLSQETRIVEDSGEPH